MSDTEPEVVDLTASTPRRRTAIPVSSSPPTGMDYSPPFRGGQPGPSRGVKRRNDQQGESSSSSHTRQNNISVTMDLTEPTIPQVTMEGPSNPKRPRPNDKEAAPERLTHSDRVIHPPSRPDTNKLNEPSQNTALLAYRCPICLDRPTLWTSTICGHLFCHRCVYEHLEFSSRSESGESSKKAKGTCPVCRTPISRSNSTKSRGVVPVVFQTRKRGDPAPTG